MKHKRWIYLATTFVIILLGLASREYGVSILKTAFFLTV